VQQITERMGRLVPTAVETELDPETAALNDLYNEA
jgi:hypothetical protein